MPEAKPKKVETAKRASKEKVPSPSEVVPEKEMKAEKKGAKEKSKSPEPVKVTTPRRSARAEAVQPEVVEKKQKAKETVSKPKV